MKVRITISMDEELVSELDELVQTNAYESRSEALEAAARLLQGRLREEAFERNLALLDPAEEQADAELGMALWAAQVAEGEALDSVGGANDSGRQAVGR